MHSCTLLPARIIFQSRNIHRCTSINRNFCKWEPWGGTWCAQTFPSQLPLCIFFWGGIHKYNKKQKLILTSYSMLLSKLWVSSCISHHMISIIMVGVN